MKHQKHDTLFKLRYSILLLPIFCLLTVPVLAQFQSLPGAVGANALSRDRAKQEVTVTGQVEDVDVSEGPKDPFILKIGTSKDGIPVCIGYLPSKFSEFHRNLPPPIAGIQVSARGKLWHWNDMLLVRPDALSDIRIQGYAHTLGGDSGSATAVGTSQPAQANSNIPYLTISDYAQIKASVGKKIYMKGSVLSWTESWSERAPNIIVAGTGATPLEVVYWTNEGQKFDPQLSKPGTPFHLHGEVQNYRGKLQVKIAGPEELSVRPLQVATQAPSSAPGGMFQSMGQASAPSSSGSRFPQFENLEACLSAALSEKKNVIVYCYSNSVAESVSGLNSLKNDSSLWAGASGFKTCALNVDEDPETFARFRVFDVPSIVVMNSAGIITDRVVDLNRAKLAEVIAKNP